MEDPKKGHRTIFDEKRVLTVGDKTPESGHESSSWEDQDLLVFVVLFDMMWMTQETSSDLFLTQPCKGATPPCGFNLVRYYF